MGKLGSIEILSIGVKSKRFAHRTSASNDPPIVGLSANASAVDLAIAIIAATEHGLPQPAAFRHVVLPFAFLRISERTHGRPDGHAPTHGMVVAS